MRISEMKFSIKERMKRYLLENSYVDRVHIVGCARSGTTMLHYAFSAFENTLLFDKECQPWDSPGLKECFQKYWELKDTASRHFMVTKRSKWWFNEKVVHKTVDYVRENNVFLIHIVRDPRDVLTSSHKLSDSPYYVTPEIWDASINAANMMFDLLGDYPRKMTIRFEDVVNHPEKVEKLIIETIGLRKKIGVQSIARLKDNVELLGKDAGTMIEYMHKLRNFDPSSIGKWRRDSVKSEYLEQLLNASPYQDEINGFLRTNGYLASKKSPVFMNN
ncbi:MAG: sulfotransferase domain-containing protein [Calditrichia bacterium]|nr:sulfotransferase domain-containing protein [Calditrichota bacterium]MCB0267154.1 sulfotransferase domain-containing protein [Calditrichota bacterium]